MMFLTLPGQSTTPILKLGFPMQTWVPKQMCKKNKLKIIKFFKISFLLVGTKHFTAFFNELKYF